MLVTQASLDQQDSLGPLDLKDQQATLVPQASRVSLDRLERRAIRDRPELPVSQV